MDGVVKEKPLPLDVEGRKSAMMVSEMSAGTGSWFGADTVFH